MPPPAPPPPSPEPQARRFSLLQMAGGLAAILLSAGVIRVQAALGNASILVPVASLLGWIFLAVGLFGLVAGARVERAGGVGTGLRVLRIAVIVLIALPGAALTYGCVLPKPERPQAETPPARPPLADDLAMQIARALASAEVITPPPPATASASTSGAAPRDVEAVLQAVVDLDALEPFLHPEVPGRVPLTLSVATPPTGIALSKFGQPVRMVASAPGGGAPCLEITQLELQGDRATVRFAYSIEGVMGSAELSKRQGRWAVVRRSVAER